MLSVCLSNQQFTLDSLKKYQQKYPEGWINWASYKGYHLGKSLINYVSDNFKKIHGNGIDKTNIEVYYYDKSMIPGTNEYKEKYKGVFNTNTYLKMDKAYSISFWIKANNESGVPVIFRNYNNSDETIISLAKNDNAGWNMKFGQGNKVLKLDNIYDEKWHHIVLYKMQAIKGNKYGITIDADKDIQNIFSNKIDGEVQLLISGLFKGQMKDVRVYNEVLTKNRINAIYNKGEITNEAELWDGEKYFSPVKHFVRK